MLRDRWQQAKDLFQSALDLPPGEREAFVERQCGDAGIRADVVRLLRMEQGTPGFLQSPVAASLGAAGGPDGGADGGASQGPADALIGRSLGGFRIIRRIGAGGMGAVYEALQEQPRRRAAVKVLRPGVFAPRMQRRFEFESEALARLQHPGIAQVFASGTFEIGGGVQPWFAMEYVDGPSIRSFVRTRAPSRPRILELLALTCDAVQHAHQRGVVHRDLKPDNILIGAAAADDAAVQPKILDFGVARSIGADVQATMHTAPGELVGTLAYMSPEQLSGDPERIDARCDVYALGVIGYELLAGRLPHGAGGGSFAEMIRAIEQQEPARLGALIPELRGDVEVIFAKALEKDAGRRYASAADLAADLRRFIRNEPVSARPATAVYQFRKFARRNRALVGGVLATMLALAAGMMLYAREARTARREADKARYEADKAVAINNFITNDFLMKLLAAANAPDAGRRLPVAELVEQAAAQAGTMFAGQPLAEAAVRNELGTIHYNLGTIEQSARQFERALELWESQLGPDHVDTLKAVNNLGQVRARQRRPKEAEALYRRALDGRIRALGEDDPFTLVTMNNLAEIYRGSDRLDEAERLLRRTLESQQRVHGPAHKNTITTLGNLGSLLMQRGAHEDALAMHRRAYEGSTATLGADHVMTAMTGVRLGVALQRVGRAPEAEPILRAVVSSVDRTLGPDNPETITAHRALARCLRELGKTAEAAEHLRLALDGARSWAGAPAGLTKKIEKELNELTKAAAPTRTRDASASQPTASPGAPP